MSKKKEILTIRLTIYPETDKVICERKWSYHGEVTQEQFDEYLAMIDEDINGDYWDNDEAYEVELTIENANQTLSGIVPILNKPSKLLYRIDIKNTFQDIRDMLYGKETRQTFENTDSLYNE